MTRRTASEILDVAAAHVDKAGFFCFMSKKTSEGYQRKLAWLKNRFAEGMRIKMLALHDRGFIEYLPGERAWRAVHADGYMIIHYLWIVGQSKGKGFATALLDSCIADAKRLKLKGVAMVTSEKVWLAGRRVIDKHELECVDTAPPVFSPVVKKFGKHPSPSFAGERERKAEALGKG